MRTIPNRCIFVRNSSHTSRISVIFTTCTAWSRRPRNLTNRHSLSKTYFVNFFKHLEIFTIQESEMHQYFSDTTAWQIAVQFEVYFTPESWEWISRYLFLLFLLILLNVFYLTRPACTLSFHGCCLLLFDWILHLPFHIIFPYERVVKRNL